MFRYILDLMNKCNAILNNILKKEAIGWFVKYRQTLLTEFKGYCISLTHSSIVLSLAISLRLPLYFSQSISLHIFLYLLSLHMDISIFNFLYIFHIIFFYIFNFLILPTGKNFTSEEINKVSFFIILYNICKYYIYLYYTLFTY